MNVTCLQNLPAPPTDKTGWPWTIESIPVPDTMPDGNCWPKVSIVTPSYNQGRFLEETIRSVLLQSYHNLEYIIMDGGSTDTSKDIIKKYERWISSWVSEKDKGQAHAINRGFRQATGDIFAWLNSDDVLLPQAVYLAVSYLHEHSDAGMVYSDRDIIDAESKVIGERLLRKFVSWQFRYCSGVNQETGFWRKKIYFECGELDESLHFGMDFDLWLRIIQKADIHHIPAKLGMYRAHGQSRSVMVDRIQKTSDEKVKRMAQEAATIRRRYFGRETTGIEKMILPRLHNIVGHLEEKFGKYNSKKRFVEQKLEELKKASTGDIESIKKYIF